MKNPRLYDGDFFYLLLPKSFPMLEVQNIKFAYFDEPILKNLSFTVDPGEHISIIGASGCGKSTLLQAIYGLHRVEGRIFWKGKRLLGPDFNLVPGEDFIKYLTQDFDLMPPLSAADNIGKYVSNMYPKKKQQRIAELLELVELQEFAKVKVKHLSGGQQQRVALARALANEPEILLLDEPFSHIDHFRKNKLRRNLFSYLKEKNITCLVATHDSTDALSFADRSFVMEEGNIIVTGPPGELYQNPLNPYVASLFSEISVVPRKWFDTDTQTSETVIIYPHELQISSVAGIEATVKRSYFTGRGYLVEADHGGTPLFFESAQALVGGRAVNVMLKDQSTLLKRK